MDSKQLAKILTEASRKASTKNMTDHQKLQVKVKTAHAAAKIEDAAALLALGMLGEQKASERASHQGVASPDSSSSWYRV